MPKRIFNKENMNKEMLDHNELKIHIDDMYNLIDEYPYHQYFAIVTFDLSKRKINKQNRITTHIISGDDSVDAIRNFLASDEGSGLFETDIDDSIMTIQLQVTE